MGLFWAFGAVHWCRGFQAGLGGALRWCCRLCSSAFRETRVAFVGVVGVARETGVAFAGVDGPVLSGWGRALVLRVSSVGLWGRALVSWVSSRAVLIEPSRSVPSAQP